jgi:hypothetical protein
VIFPLAGVQSVSFCMYVVSFVKRARVRKRSSTPRLPDLCRPHAQRTKRLQEALCRLGLKMGGQAGADTGQEQGLSGSRDTILRLVRRFPQPAESSPRIIGLDDWGATRKVACVAVRTPERRILPGVLPPVPYQAESSAPGTM